MAVGPATISKAGYDLGLAALQQFTKGEFNVTLDHPDYFFCNDFLSKAEIKDGGKYFTWEVLLGKTGNASMVGYYETYTPNVKNITKEGIAYWAKSHTSYTYDIDEVNVNSDATEVYNLLKSRRANATVEWADLLEPLCLLTPTSASDELNPTGIFTWLAPPVYSTGTTATVTGDEGFIGQNPIYSDGAAYASRTAFSAGGIDASFAANQGCELCR